MKPPRHYRDVAERDGRLYVGRVLVAPLDADGKPIGLRWGGVLPTKIADKLGLPVERGKRLLAEYGESVAADLGERYDLRSCRDRVISYNRYGHDYEQRVNPGCGAWFIVEAASSLRCCAQCRTAIDRARVARWTAKRSAKRAAACEQRRPIACAVCGKPLAAIRSTRKTCSDKCRQALRRGTGQHVNRVA
jgi:hypothetical protein